MVRGIGLGSAGLLLVACASAPRPVADRRGVTTVVELAALEVRDDGIDRFEHCPPAGEIGQGWLPSIPEWHPPSASTSAAVPDSSVEQPGPQSAPVARGDVAEPATAESSSSLLRRAEAATHAGFRHCYHQGLMYDPTQDGHVAFVLRVDRAGHVASVETWGACDLTPDALVCMRDEVAHLRLPPPEGGSASVVLPAVFTSGFEHRRHGPPASETFTAAAYVSIEAVRPLLHACLGASRREGTGLVASAVMAVDVDADGQGSHVDVDQWKGSHELLGCAAGVIRDARYPKPPAGKGRVIVPVVFNPRPGTR